MDPFSALAIAMATIQVIDFSSKLVSVGREVYRKGSLATEDELKVRTNNLRDLVKSLQSSLQSSRPDAIDLVEDTKVSPASVSDVLVVLTRLTHRQRLCDTATEVEAIASDLIVLLKKAESCSRRSVLGSVRKALIAVSSASKVAKLKEKLDTHRSDLVLRIIISLKLNHKLSEARQDERFKELDERSKSIAESILENRNFFTTGFSDIQASLDSQLSQSNQATEDAQRRHEETIAAISTLQHWLGEKDLEAQTIFRSLTDNLARSSLGDLRDIQNQILDYLWFRNIHSRADEVVKQHQGTFEWAFEVNTQQDSPECGIAYWLQAGAGCFWVGGKAGSGKSTLMKYIIHDPRTHRLLLSWAAGKTLVMTSFFFWNAGSSLQKSQVGLLRSILYDILSRHPELIPVAFPAQCRAASRNRIRESDPSLSELKRAFELLMTQEVSSLKICLFIDGVDEYEGNHAELADLLHSTASQRVKLFVSSRPTPLFCDKFSAFPQIMLQNHTGPDIIHFIVDRLTMHRRMVELFNNHRSQILKLFEKIVDKASGVFLWVALVTTSLSDGLTNGDRLSDLDERLDQLPPGIDKLYLHMLNNMDPIYRKDASRLLQIVHHNNTTAGSEPISPLKLLFAIDENPHAAINAEITPLIPAELLEMVKHVFNRVRSRCCGLLEVHMAEDSEEGNRSYIELILKLSSVDFLHKSVADFLQQEEIRATLSCYAPPGFNATVSLASSSLRTIKGMLPEVDVFIDKSEVWAHLHNGLTECLLAEDNTGKSQEELLEEFDEVMDWHWRAAKGWIPRYGKPLEGYAHWSHLIPGPEGNNDWGHFGPAHDSVYSIACRFGLKLYVGSRLQQSESSDNMTNHGCIPEGRTLAQTALNRIICDINVRQASPLLLQKQIEILKLSLEHGADPNSVFWKGRSPWTLALGRYRGLSGHEHTTSEAETWSEVIEALVNNGADANAQVIDAYDTFDNSDTHLWESPLRIIKSMDRPYGLVKTDERRLKRINTALQNLLARKGAIDQDWNLTKEGLWGRGVI
jgi:hypothetical protein